MDISSKKEFDLYKDIQNRTDGEVYLGIVGPVRTGKSTFIKRFMDLMVLPYMEDVHSRQRTIDELPQSAQGKTIMTTEPKFIPKDAAEIALEDDTRIKIRLIDCVGFMVDGATGHMEGSVDRMVHTPWFDHEIPFVEAASIGTEKVIRDHATIGIVVTTDGSIGDLPRENYVNAEEQTVQELEEIGKPYVVVLNSTRPYSEETVRIAEELREKYEVVGNLSRTANGSLTGSVKLDFETYVQRKYFRQIIQAANRRLAKMTSGGFILQCRELKDLSSQGQAGLDLDVYDLVTDSVRDVKSLSGGESFMAALSMALGLADIIQNTAGAVSLETMFVDEGFGSLDDQSRERAIRILKELAGEKGLVGIISHVNELKEQIDWKLTVTKSGHGSHARWII